MKLIIVGLFVLISSQTFAASFALSSFISSGNICKEATETINDTQDFIQSGILSAALEQKLNDVKAENANLSTEEALDLLVTNANMTLESASK